MFKRLLIVFVSFCSLLSAANHDLEKYLLYVTAIDDEFHSIALSNGWVCNVNEAFWGREKKYEIGDEVSLQVMFWVASEEESIKTWGEFLLGEDSLQVWISEDSKSSDISYVGTTSECVTPGGWFTSPVYKKCIHLSDGSKWEASDRWDRDENQKFYEGDRIFVSYHQGKWQLINMDRFVIVPIIGFTGHRFADITPFPPIP